MAEQASTASAESESRAWTPGGWVIRRSGDFDFVTARIAVGGGIWDERDVQAVLDAGITHVVTVARELEDDVGRLLAGRATHLANGTVDNGEAKRIAWFRRSIAFSVRALQSNPNAKVLLHCGAGINRGPSRATRCSERWATTRSRPTN